MSSPSRKIPALLALACVLLAENALPPSAAWAGGVWLSEAASAAVNGTWSGRNPTEYTIGGVLSGSEGIERYFTQILSEVERVRLLDRVRLGHATQTMDTNPIKTAIMVCSELIQRKVYAIVVSKPRLGELSPASVSYTAGFYHIPVIGISSRDSAFSDKNIHVSFLRTVPPYSHQADVWVELLKRFKYRQLVFVHSSDTDGRALLGRFQTKTQDLQAHEDQEVKVEMIEEFEPGLLSYHGTLLKVKECQARVYFLYASTMDAYQIFSDAARLNMTGEGYVWIVTEQALKASNVPRGAIGLQLVGAEDERGHINDSLNVLAQALLELHTRENVTEAPGNCNTSGNLWDTGRRFFDYIRRQILPDGETGRVAFDAMGDRINAEYRVVNVQRKGDNREVGTYNFSTKLGRMELTLREDRIVWPGGLRQKPTGLMIPTHLKVITVPEKPFVYARRLGQETVVVQGEDNFATSNMDEAIGTVAAKEKAKKKTTIGTGIIVDGAQDDDDDDAGNSDKKRKREKGRTKKNNNRDNKSSSSSLPPSPSSVGKEAPPRIKRFPPNECDADLGEIPCPVYDKSAHQARSSKDSRHPASSSSSSSSPSSPSPSSNANSSYCCRGYCIDLLRLLSDKSNFTFNLYLSFDEYGALERNNKSGKEEWTGLIGEIVEERADLIVAPLTINPERAQVMEFSKPFKYQGITILQKRQSRASQLVSFLQPFKYTLWFLVLVSVHVVALCLYLLDRFSPFGRFQRSLPNDKKPVLAVAQQKEESLNMTSAIWFAWGVLLNSGIGEGTPRSFSARVLGMVWAGFAMIIVASYTANLAAFLVLDKPQTSLTGINDPRLRNPMENFTYATVKGSSVDMYFRRQVELSNMYRTMEGNYYENPEQAIQAVKDESLHAFIWDSSRLEFEAARHCDLITAGDLFGRSGYGIGLQKGSPWADKVTLAILDFHESGRMEDLDNNWILLNKEVVCANDDDNSPATLGLKNMRGVFIVVGVGIVLGLVLIVVEIVYKRHQMGKIKRIAAARKAATRWRGSVERQRTCREFGLNNGGVPRASSAGPTTSSLLTPDSLSPLCIDSLPRRVAYHTEQMANCGDGGDKYWQIMRGSASPERNGLGKVDFSATEDRARNGARPRSAQSAVNGRRFSSSVVSPDKHAMTDPEALTSDPDDDDDDVDDDDEEELVRGTRSQIEGRHCSDDGAADVCVGAGSTPTVIYANPPPPPMMIHSRKSAGAKIGPPPTGPLPPIPPKTFANQPSPSLVYLHQQQCPSNNFNGNKKKSSAVVVVRSNPKSSSAKKSAKSGRPRGGGALSSSTVPGGPGGRKWQKKRQQQHTQQMWPHDQYPQHYLKCQAAIDAGENFHSQQPPPPPPPPNDECDLRLRGVPRPPPPPKAYYPSQEMQLQQQKRFEPHQEDVRRRRQRLQQRQQQQQWRYPDFDLRTRARGGKHSGLEDSDM